MNPLEVEHKREQQLMCIAVLAYRASLQVVENNPNEFRVLDSYIAKNIDEQLWLEIDQLSKAYDGRVATE